MINPWDKVGFYFWDADNLGDAPLNKFLLPLLFPAMNFTGPKKYIIVMCGSILGQRSLMQDQISPWLIVGAGHHDKDLNRRFKIPDNSHLFGVRGKLTIKRIIQEQPRITLHDPISLIDPAVVTPLVLPINIQKEQKEDHATIMKYNWKGKQSEHVFTTKTQWNVPKWITKLCSYKKITTDSLHAAILSDAYGIPWKPLRWEIKWADHFEQLGINSKPTDFVLSERSLLETKQKDFLLSVKNLTNFIENES